MMKCKECGTAITGGVCRNCGLVEEDYQEYDFGDSYPYDKENESFSYGGARTHAISDISVMTKVNKAECLNPNLRRALRWDGNYNWHVQKTEIVNEEIRQVCRSLDMNGDFLQRCYLLFKRIRDVMSFTGKKLEDLAASIVYLQIRLDDMKIDCNLIDFVTVGYNKRRLYRYYRTLVNGLQLSHLITPQNPEIFAVKFINGLLENKQWDYSKKRELTIKTIDLFKRFVYEFNKGEIDGSNNIGIGGLAACMYIIFNVTQEEISDVCGVSEVTIRTYVNRIKGMYKDESSDR